MFYINKKKLFATILSLCIVCGYVPVYNNYAKVSGCNKSAEEIIIPPEVNGVPVTSIGGGAFYDCSLTSINIPNSVTYIGEDAFTFSQLTSVSIPEGITSIEDYVFAFCLNLTSIDIPETVTTIKDSAFRGIPNLESITIPKNVTSIGERAFYYCSNLKSITILNPNCEIYDMNITISNGLNDNNADYFGGTIYGYEGSTAQEYAEKYGYNFAIIGENSPATTEPTETTTTETTTTTITEETTTTTAPTTETVAGDSNGDGQISLADAVAILQYVANPEKYPLSEQGLVNADVYNKGDGVTGMDALMIQQYDSGTITSLE